MSSLEDFEKALAAEKEETHRSERDREDRHRHHSRHHRSHRDERDDRKRDDRSGRGDRDGHRDRERRRSRSREGDRHRRRRNDDDDGHRSKRSKHHRDDDRRDRSRDRSHRHRDRDGQSHMKSGEQKEDLPIPDDETPRVQDSIDEGKKVTRDDWMTAPSAMDIDYVQRKKKEEPKPREEPKKVVPKNLIHVDVEDKKDESAERTINYTIGDSGSNWRMMKLKGVYNSAKEQGCPVDDVVLERFGSFQEFDEAREEEEELEKRKLYGAGYEMKEKPSGDFHRERMERERKNAPPAPAEPEQGKVVPDQAATNAPAAIMDQTALNRLRATMMKAKLRKSPDAAKLEEEYNLAAAAFASAGESSEAVVLGVMHNRQLAGQRGEVKAVTNRRGRERGNVEENEDMSIEDMVREEKRTKHNPGGEGLRLAERIAKDGKFGDDLEYMDENAEKLAKRVHKNEINLKNMAVGEFQKMNRILDNCPLCHHEDQEKPPIAPVISLGTRVFLTLQTEPEISKGGAVIVPIAHRGNLLECDDDEWEEIRNFMKSLVRMYHEKGQEVVFYENAANPGKRAHAAMVATPIPYEEGAMAPAYFREAFMTSDEEWSQHRKIIDTGKNATTGGMGRMAFRKSIAKEMPYFHVWFNLDGGLGHVVENLGKWPRGDGFAREVLGGIVGAEGHVIKKQGRWVRGDGRVEGFKKGWEKFDWTRVLSEGG